MEAGLLSLMGQIGLPSLLALALVYIWIMRVISKRDKEIHSRVDGAINTANESEKKVLKFKVDVAEKYASQQMISEMEKRIMARFDDLKSTVRNGHK